MLTRFFFDIAQLDTRHRVTTRHHEARPPRRHSLSPCLSRCLSEMALAGRTSASRPEGAVLGREGALDGSMEAQARRDLHWQTRLHEERLRNGEWSGLDRHICNTG